MQQHRHFSEDGARLGDGGDDGVALDDLEAPLDQDKQVTGGFALPDHERALGHAAPVASDAIFENVPHAL